MHVMYGYSSLPSILCVEHGTFAPLQFLALITLALLWREEYGMGTYLQFSL